MSSMTLAPVGRPNIVANTLTIARRFSERVRRDSEAKISTQGLLGDKIVEISMGTTAAPALKPGEITKTPVETEYGWHVIQVEDRRPVQPPPFDSVREQLYNQLSRQVIADQLEKLRAKAKVERFNLDGTPRKE